MQILQTTVKLCSDTDCSEIDFYVVSLSGETRLGIGFEWFQTAKRMVVTGYVVIGNVMVMKNILCNFRRSLLSYTVMCLSYCYYKHVMQISHNTLPYRSARCDI